MAESKSLPSIQQLARDAWVLFKETWVTYLKLAGVAVGYVFLVFLVGVLLTLFATFSTEGSYLRLFSQMTPFNIVIIILFIVWFIFFFVSLFAIEISFPIAGVFILQKKNAPKIIDLIKSTKPFFWSYFIVVLLSGLFSIGGMGLLIIPGILIAFFFSFVLYEVVIGNQKGMTALKNSYFMVKNNFWEIFLRLFVLEIALFILTSVINKVAARDLFVGLVQFLFSLFASWYARAYIFVLYKEVRAKTKFPEQISISWIWVVSIIGGVLLVLFISGFTYAMMHLPQTHPGHMHKVSPGAV